MRAISCPVPSQVSMTTSSSALSWMNVPKGFSREIWMRNVEIFDNRALSSPWLPLNQLWHVVLVDQVLKVIYLIRNKWQDCHTLCKIYVESTRFISKAGRKIFWFSCSSDRRRSTILSLLSSSAVRSIISLHSICYLFLSIFSFSKSLPHLRSCSRMDPSHPEIMDVITITFPTNIVVMIGILTW